MKRHLLKVTAGLGTIVISALALLMLQTNAQANTNFGSCVRDNDTNATIRNGACDTNELISKYKANTTKDLPAVFKAYGVPTDNLGSAKKGEVRKNGDVVVDGQIVATGAKTVGRHFINGSTKKTYSGHTFYERSPRVSFSANAIKAFVYFNKDGTFRAAVLTACGNPVTATPKPKPAYKCSTLKAIAVDRTRFDLTVTTAQTHATFKSVTLTFYKDGKKVESKTSTSKTYRYTQPTDGIYTAKAVVTFAVEGHGTKTTAESATCSTSFEVKKQPSTPVYACTTLVADKTDRTHFSFSITTTQKDATFKKVTYVISNAAGVEVDRFDANTKTSSYTRTEPGEFTVKATPTFTVNGQEKTTASTLCTATFEVAEASQYSCDGLTATTIGEPADRNYQYALTYTAKNGAMLTSVDFDFGDNTTETVAPADLAKVAHKYTAQGDFNTTAILHFNVNDTAREATCALKITASSTKITPCAHNPNLPVGHPDCKKKEVCVYNANLPADSKDCKKPATPASVEIPKTGPGETVSALAGLGSLTAAGYYYRASRRHLISKHLRR
jgi:hypothetical protein